MGIDRIQLEWKMVRKQCRCRAHIFQLEASDQSKYTYQSSIDLCPEFRVVCRADNKFNENRRRIADIPTDGWHGSVSHTQSLFHMTTSRTVGQLYGLDRRNRNEKMIKLVNKFKTQNKH